jgi:hypothetical protein
VVGASVVEVDVDVDVVDVVDVVVVVEQDPVAITTPLTLH